MSDVTPEERARRQERNARTLRSAVRRREALIDELAPDGECAECGEHFAARDLVVDHVDGVDFDRYRMSPQMRAARYWRQHLAGEPLRALCNPCSCRDGNRRKHAQARRWECGQR